MKVTRRKLAAALAGSAAVAAAQALPQAVESNDELLKAARERIRNNGELLARQEVPMSTEPAFQFKA
jgi:hypothetical protein